MNTEKKRDFLIRFAYAVVIIFLVYFFFKYIIKWIMPFFIAFIIAALLYPLIKFFSRKLKIKKNTKPVAAVITTLFFCTVGVLVGFIIYRLIVAIGGFIASLPDFVKNTIMPNLMTAYEKVRALLANLNIELDAGSKTFFDSIQGGVRSLVSGILPSFSVITSIPGMLITILIMIISTFFISMDFKRITLFCLSQLPKKAADFVLMIKDYTVKILFKYIRSYALILLITFGELMIGFGIMHFITGLQNIFLLALLIAVFDILPIVGTGTILIPWAIIELIIGNYATAICLLVIYTVITVIRQFIEPKIVGQQVGLHPVATLLAMILGSRLFGGLGLLGVPIALAIIKDLNDHGKIHVFKPIREHGEDGAGDGAADGEQPPDGSGGDGAESAGGENAGPSDDDNEI